MPENYVWVVVGNKNFNVFKYKKVTMPECCFLGWWGSMHQWFKCKNNQHSGVVNFLHLKYSGIGSTTTNNQHSGMTDIQPWLTFNTMTYQ